jgi:hypothetical protein
MRFSIFGEEKDRAQAGSGKIIAAVVILSEAKNLPL